MQIFITSDHGGFKLKEELLNILKESGFQVEDLGPFNYEANDDYPDYVKILSDKMKVDITSRGILICKNGVGVCMSANKFKHIRAALSWNETHIQSCRRDDNVNVLCLAADYISLEEAKKILLSFLNTSFSNEERHIRRLYKIENFNTTN